MLDRQRRETRVALILLAFSLLQPFLCLVPVLPRPIQVLKAMPSDRVELAR